jgi:ABC-2 type transport system permease protein
MRKLFVVLQREYMERVRTRWFLFATVFGPVFFGMLMFMPSWLANRSQAAPETGPIRILDATTSGLGNIVANELILTLTDTVRNQFSVVAPDALAQAESIAVRDVRNKTIRAYLVVDSATLDGRGARFVGLTGASVTDARALEYLATRELVALDLVGRGIASIEADRIKRLRVPVQATTLSQGGRATSGRVNLLFASIVGILLYTTILMYGQNVLRGVIEEKQTRVAEVVVSSVHPTTLLAGKVLGVGAVGLTQMTIWMIATTVMARYRAPLLQYFGFQATSIPFPSVTAGQIALLLVFFLLGYTLYSALFAAVGAMVSSEQEAQQAQMPIILMLIMSIMFLQPVLAEPDGKLAIALGFMPISSPIMMPLRMSTVEVATWEITLSIVTLIAGCYLAVYFAAKVYRTGLLMHGKRVSFREVFKWIKWA